MRSQKRKEDTEIKTIMILITVIVTVLSIAAGAAKVMQTPQEMEFLQGAGLSETLIMVFGLVQTVGGVLLLPQKTRLSGAVLAALAFMASSVLIFIGGNITFGLFSILPVVLAGIVAQQSVRAAPPKLLNTDAGDAGSR